MNARRTARRRLREDRGSLSLELVGFVAVVVTLVLVCVQGLAIARAGAAVQQAARDGARAATLPGRSVPAAVDDALPGFVTVRAVRTGAAAKPSCAHSCVAVEAEVPVGVAGIRVATVVVTRDAEMPRG